jgi:hypothetical protein
MIVVETDEGVAMTCTYNLPRMPPRVSVLLPAYNAEPFVAAAVESVLAQTFADWELVAVDDASTDGTLDLLRRFASDRVHIHQNDRNLGMTGNWNRALSVATGELVIKLDADDALKPHAIEALVGALDDPSVVAAGIRTLMCDIELAPFDGIPGDDAIMRAGIDPYRDTVLPGSRWYDIAAHGHQLWASTAIMFRREILASLGGWDERLGCASDTDVIWRFMELDRPIAHRGEIGALYRVRPGSVSDVYRSQGWLTWEGIAANLASLARYRKTHALRRGLRMHYVRFWNRWQRGAAEREALPPELRAKLEQIMTAVPPPPAVDVLMTRARDAVSAS